MEPGQRILVIDDNPSILQDFRRILSREPASSGLSAMEVALLGAGLQGDDEVYHVDSAHQGPEGVEAVKRAIAEHAPYALAFVDMRMPPGPDGLETIEQIWAVDGEIQIVLCTAHSDHSRGDMRRRLGVTDRWLLLKKPFDVAEVRQLAGALTEKWRLARRAKELEGLKDDFISTVSHELRTPMTSIRGSLSLLENGVVGSLTGDAMELVQIARANAERLIRLINDMLDLHKIQAGRLDHRPSRVAIPGLVVSAVDGVRALALEAGVAQRIDVVFEGPIVGDEDRLVQVLTNLLSNAIKFTPRGGVVTVKVEPAGADFVRFWVIDHGSGIEAGQIPRLFQRFQQVDSSSTRATGGTGLGLAICKAIVERHGGSIGVESTVGEGSRFWFDLPRRPEPPAAT